MSLTSIDLLLPLVDQTGENHQQQLPGMENEARESPMLKAASKNSRFGWRSASANRAKWASDARS
jgi:hypothetical protein